MARNSGKVLNIADGIARNKARLEDEVDALFMLPLAQFTGARNELAARLKREGHPNESNLVKALAKPPISAWAVNQLYWQHREAFDSLLAAGQRFRQAQTAGLAGKVARESLETRRKALLQLTDLATSLLQDAGHNPGNDTIRRVNTTLEAMSALASLSDGPTPGRLTQDVDPPGFESLASFIPSGGTARSQKLPRPTAAKKSGSAPTIARQEATSARDARQREETRRAIIAAAKVSLQEAKKSLAEARAQADRSESAQKKALAEAREAEKQKREAEARFKKATAASQEAAQHARAVADEAHDAAKAVDDARRALEKATKELDSLIRES